VVLALGPLGASAVEELLVMADHVPVEDRDVAAGGLDVDVTEQSRADVNGQPLVDQLGGEVPAEIVRGDGDALELRPRRVRQTGSPSAGSPSASR
jgi:hypothetical protein